MGMGSTTLWDDLNEQVFTDQVIVDRPIMLGPGSRPVSMHDH
jgi:hypothetical protein